MAAIALDGVAASSSSSIGALALQSRLAAVAASSSRASGVLSTTVDIGVTIDPDVTVSGSITADAPVVAPPAGIQQMFLLRVSPVMPAPTITNGKPQDGWAPTSVTREKWGRFQLVIDGVDVTFFRDKLTQVQSWSNAEPFGDGRLTVVFPQVTPYDQLGVGALDWLKDWAGVELYRVLPDGSKEAAPLFEGMVASFEDALGADDAGLSVECIGALYQLDLYRRAPLHTTGDVRVEDFLAAQFSHGTRPNLRTQEMLTEYPSWWGTASDPNAAKHVEGGVNITGFLISSTGDWSSVLTSYVHDQLAYMQEEDATHGHLMWTLRHDAGRQPVLALKDMSTVHWTVTAGTPGVEHNLSRDLTQSPNTLYGEGTDQAGTRWRNAYLRDDGSMTSYRPLAIASKVSRYINDTLFEENTPNPEFDPQAVRFETHQNYGTGVSLAQAQESARLQIAREAEPGWYGTLTLNIDPEQGSRFRIRSGRNILLKSYRGADVLLHIAQAEVDPWSGTVSLMVDTKARDLLTLAQLIERRESGNRNPARKLRIGSESGTVADERAPWDVYAGSGMMPRASTRMQLDGIAPTTVGYRPMDDATLYIRVDADALSAGERWAFAPVSVQEYGNIAIIDLRAYVASGAAAAVPFHVGFYGNWLGGQMNVTYMPLDSTGTPNPFSAGVFDDPNNVDPSRVIILGQNGQRAGYSPGLESEGDAPTGVLREEGGFVYDLPEGEMAMWVAIYCEHTEDVYFQGRLFRGSD